MAPRRGAPVAAAVKAEAAQAAAPATATGTEEAAPPPPERKRKRAAAPRSAALSPFAAFAQPLQPLPPVPAALAALPPPFVAPSPALWRERFAPCCAVCFAASTHCMHHAELPLRLLIVGHNPSDTAWATGFPYANPSNRFWGLMQRAGLVPPEFACSDADAAPALVGLGITDVGCSAGSDANAFKRPQMRAWRGELVTRLRAHCARAAAWAGAAGGADDVALAAFAPRVIAFSGKRQWSELFEPPLKNVAHGLRPAAERPPGWPHALLAASEVWVLPSSSGRAVMTKEEREGPYQALGQRVALLPWPR